jgi:tetratricopeptide (TPR) repeat protein
VNAKLARLKSLALRPLWSESDEYRARRRCRTILATPFAALAGLAWGVLSASDIGVGSQFLWGSLGAFSFAFLMYLEQRLVPAMAALGSRIRAGAGGLAAMLWEGVVVGGITLFLTRVFEAPLVPGVGAALAVGAFYAVVMEYVICGSAASDVAAALHGRTSATPFPEQFSEAEALVGRGRYEEAAGLYRRALEASPRDGVPYTRLARVRLRQGRHQEAIDALRTAQRKADLTLEQDVFFTRQIHEIAATKLSDPAQAVDDIHSLIERCPEGPHLNWAHRTLAEIRDGSGPADPHTPLATSIDEALDFVIELDDERRFEVEEDFEVARSYSLGNDLIPQERFARDGLYLAAEADGDSRVPAPEADDDPAEDSP